MRTAEDLRRDFLLDPGIAHLNHGSYGATPRPVLAHQQQLRDALERDPVEFLGRRLPELLAGVRGELADHLGVAEPARLVLVSNATTALNAVATSLPLGPGDEVVVTDREYGAMGLLWTEVARRTGARLVVAPLPLPVAHADRAAGGDLERRDGQHTRALLQPRHVGDRARATRGGALPPSA